MILGVAAGQVHDRVYRGTGPNIPLGEAKPVHTSRYRCVDLSRSSQQVKSQSINLSHLLLHARGNSKN